ncbi:MAG: hypothetical protein H0U71_04810 [Gammaproteobacteria bacterium]|nr:hypothetical protein [Gammaproteobacteria bacterium]
MKTKILLLILCLNLSSNVLAVSLTAKKKYPYSLITGDYGILSEEDLGHYNKTFTPKSFSKENRGGFYWQCFPRELVNITLEDMGYSSEDWGWTDTAADLNIKVYIKPNIIHHYYMRRAFPLATYQERFTRWHKLMAKQKYVCFGGEFDGKKTELENESQRQVYYWTFEKIKTKKGNDCLLGI